MSFLRTGVDRQTLHKPDDRELTISNGIYSMQEPPAPDTNDTAAQLARQLASRIRHINPDNLAAWK